MRQLVDVLLERKVDVAPGVADRAALDDGANILAGHPRAQPGLDRRVLEVEEVARVVPDKAGLGDRPAVTAGLARGLEHDEHFGPRGGARAMQFAKPAARHARADHDVARAPEVTAGLAISLA